MEYEWLENKKQVVLVKDRVGLRAWGHGRVDLVEFRAV
jgi:hypothetical protein